MHKPKKNTLFSEPFFSKIALIIILSILGNRSALAQIESANQNVYADSAEYRTQKASNPSNDTSITDLESKYGIKISADAITDAIRTKAKDSALIDVSNNRFYLYGDASAEYLEMEITAGSIIYDQATGIVSAEALRDSNGVVISTQNFKQGNEQFSFDKLQYNMNSRRAVVSNAKSQYGEGFVQSEQVKRNPDETIYGYKNTYTTCNLDTPHFCIRANRIKVIPGKIIASGPANLELEQIPTPLWFPFGIFPVNPKQSSGFILPSYTLEQRRGLGLMGGGYYFAVNDYIGVTATLDIFSKGSWGGVIRSQYANRYKYNGQLAVGYNYTKYGEVYEPNGEIIKDYNIQWQHTQDGKARPGTNFSASVNIVSRDYNKLNGVNMQQLLQNSFSSSISYSKSWIGKPYNLTASLRHNQNTQNRLVTVTLPEMNFSVSQFNPFKFKKSSLGNRWYEKITATYNTQFSNQISFYDTAFSFQRIKLSDFNNGMIHNVNISAGYNILRYFNLSFNMPYTEYWNTKKYYDFYNEAEQRQDTFNSNQFSATRSFSFSTALSTRIFGTKLFKTGKIMGVRHVILPSISANFQPGFAKAPFNYFYYGRRNDRSEYAHISPYGNNLYTPLGGPSNALPVGSLGISLGNNVSMKIRGNDTTQAEVVNLIDRLNFNTSYNFFADSQKLAPITMYFGNAIKDIITISGGMTFDPYLYKYNSLTKTYIRSAEYLLKSSQKIPARISRANISLGLRFAPKESDKKAREAAREQSEQVDALLSNGGYDSYYDFNIPYEFHLNYSMDGVRYYRDNDIGSIKLNHSVIFGGFFTFTENWQFRYESGYNFTQKQLSVTSLNISRDLHCWQMSLNLVPFGLYRSFSFALNVKSSVLQDLKLLKRKSYLDNF